MFTSSFSRVVLDGGFLPSSDGIANPPRHVKPAIGDDAVSFECEMRCREQLVRLFLVDVEDPDFLLEVVLSEPLTKAKALAIVALDNKADESSYVTWPADRPLPTWLATRVCS